MWSEAEIDSVLGTDSAAFKSAYGVTAAGNWRDPHRATVTHEATTILNQLHLTSQAVVEGLTSPGLAASRIRLWEHRNLRHRPERDYKILTDWNGMTISALTSAAMVFGRRDWLGLAERVFALVCSKLSLPDGSGRLFHSYAGVAKHPALLDDYAQMIRAGLALYQATMQPHYLAQAERWTSLVAEDFWDSSAGGYFMSDAQRSDLIERLKTAQDSATPSGNAVMVENHVKLHYLTGQQAELTKAEQCLDGLSGAILRSPVGHAALLNGFETLVAMVQVHLVLPEHCKNPESPVSSLPSHPCQPSHTESSVPPESPANRVFRLFRLCCLGSGAL